MVPVRRIAHATFETPDVDKLIDYYTNVIGLSLVAREKDGAYLAGILNHAVVLRKGDTARCSRISFQIAPDDDLVAFEKQINGHGLKTRARRTPSPAYRSSSASKIRRVRCWSVSNARRRRSRSRQGPDLAVQARPCRLQRRRREEDH